MYPAHTDIGNALQNGQIRSIITLYVIGMRCERVWRVGEWMNGEIKDWFGDRCESTTD
jgi:hypothetical protein